jgi:hypothetical protein
MYIYILTDYDMQCIQKVAKPHTDPHLPRREKKRKQKQKCSSTVAMPTYRPPAHLNSQSAGTAAYLEHRPPTVKPVAGKGCTHI